MCPYLKGSKEGATCGVTRELVRNIDGITIKVCMSRHYEACSIYIVALQKMTEPTVLHNLAH
jgi:hypothetical protein